MKKYYFRGKSLNGEWVVGNNIIADDLCFINGVEVAPNTIGQWIGCNDKKGRKIFEGDIVVWDEMSNGRYWRIAQVRMCPDIQFDCSKISEFKGIVNSSDYTFEFGSFVYTDTEQYLEIVGNIYDDLN